MGCISSKPSAETKIAFPEAPRPAEEVEREEAREAIKQRAALAAAEVEKAQHAERRMRERADAAAKRAVALKEDALRASKLAERLDDPGFDPLAASDNDDDDESPFRKSQDSPSEEEVKNLTVSDAAKMFENLSAANNDNDASEKRVRKLNVPDIFAGMQMPPPPPEIRPPPGGIIFPDETRVYRPPPAPVSPMTPPSSISSNVRSRVSPPIRERKSAPYKETPSPHTLSAPESSVTSTSISPVMPTPPPAHHARRSGSQELSTESVTPPGELAYSTDIQMDKLSTGAPAPPPPPPMSNFIRGVQRTAPVPFPYKRQGGGAVVGSRISAYEQRDAAANASPTLVQVSHEPGRNVSSRLENYERLDANARAAPELNSNVSVQQGSRVSGRLAAYEQLDADARAAPDLTDAKPAQGKRVSVHLAAYEQRDAEAKMTPSLTNDNNVVAGSRVSSAMKWSENLERGAAGAAEYNGESDEEYYSIGNIQLRQKKLLVEAGRAPISELPQSTVLHPTVERSFASKRAQFEPDRQRTIGLLAMFEAKDAAAAQEAEIESVEHRFKVAAKTRAMIA